MKKTFILFLVMCLTVGAFAQDNEKKSENLNDWAKWSIAVEGGASLFDGDVSQDYGKTVFPTADLNFTFGAAIEKTFTPVWSMGVDYYYLPLSAAPKGKVYSFDTKMHNVSLFTSFNALKGFFPKTTTKWGIWGGVGLGVSFHKVNYQTENIDGTMINTAWGKYPDADYKNDKGRAIFVPLHLLIEYNVCNSLALGLKGQFRGYFVDDIDGRFRSNANDALEMATLQLRYKFNANKKQHTRNINMATFNGDKDYDSQIFSIITQIDGLGLDIEGLRNQLNNLDPRDPRYDELERRVKELEERPVTVPKYIDEEAYVFFDFDKTDLDTEAYKAIEIAARKLKEDPTLQIEVRGFADNMGTVEYNKGLSQRRADVVKEALINTHGIDADRIFANGKGKLTDPPIAYRPNRRCDFYYFK